MKTKNLPKRNLKLALFGFPDSGKTTYGQKVAKIIIKKNTLESFRNITIKINVVYCNFYFCKNCKKIYRNKNCQIVDHDTKLLELDLVDNAGHSHLMHNTVLTLNYIDLPLLIISTVEKEYQEKNVLTFLELFKFHQFKELVIILTKVDLVTNQQVFKTKNKVENILKNYSFKVLILPSSISSSIEIATLLSFCYRFKNFRTRELVTKSKFFFEVFKSFNVNRLAQPIESLKGPIIGGITLSAGTNFNTDKMEIFYKNLQDYSPCPIRLLKTLSFKTLKNRLTDVKDIASNRFFTAELDLEPSIGNNDNLCGLILTSAKEDILPLRQIFLKIVYNFSEFSLKTGQVLLLVIRNNKFLAQITKVKNRQCSIKLDKNYYRIFKNEKVVLFKKVNHFLSLFGLALEIS